MTGASSFSFPVMYGAEYGVLPLVSLVYLFGFTDFTVPAILLNGFVITVASAGAALWRSRELSKIVEKRRKSGDGDWYRMRFDPIWPGLSSLVLFFFAALQLIAAVSHISWHRKGDFISDVFDR